MLVPVPSTAPAVAGAPALPPALAASPRLGDWLRMLAGGTVVVRSGKVELGQGLLTALAQVAAEELDVDVHRVRMTPAATGTSPNEGYTAGSLSVQTSGAALRVVCAEARAAFLQVAGERLGVRPAELTVRDGTIGAPDGRATSYWELAEENVLDRPATGLVDPKPASAYRLVGTSLPRLDLPAKLTGQPGYIHDLAPAGLRYGRVVRPPGRGALLIEVNTEATLALPGVLAVVQDGSFLAVVAEREEVAVRAEQRLRTDSRWKQEPGLPDESDLIGFLRTAPSTVTVIAEHGPEPTGPTEPTEPTATMEAAYHRPFIAHASIGPSCAIARASDGGDGLEVWTHSQGIYVLRRELARALGIGEDSITVRHADGAGCYGHNGADDAAFDAALLALRVPGAPIQVVWSRADELGWAPFGPAAVVRVAAEVGADGGVRSWRHETWSNGHLSRPGFTPTVGLLGASHRDGGQEIEAGAEPPLSMGGGAARNAVPGYAFDAYRVLHHQLRDMPLRTSSLRALGAFVNVFAAESFMDELADSAGRDPVEYRLAHLADPRARAVVEAAAELAGWASWSPGDSVGHGIGYARYKNTSSYCAVVAEVEAVREVRVRRLTAVVDAGLVINPNGAENQIEGGAIQATSWALKEQVRFDRSTVTSDSWETYPILRFSEVPPVSVHLLSDNGNPSLGVGETAQGPTVAAIGNAIFDALGVRVRTLPFNERNIVAAMD